MTKIATGLWGAIIDFDNLYTAWLGARQRKRYHSDVMRYGLNVEENLIDLQNSLIHRTWKPGKQKEFIVMEPKRRCIQAPPFADRVLHHALVQVVEPHFENRFIYDSYACRKDKGTQRAVFRTQQFVRAAIRNHGKDVYIVKADISGYFASIKHNIFMTSVERVIREYEVLWLWGEIIKGYGHDSGIGLPVGALTSQLGANIQLDPLDHYAKDDLGLKYYVRYMDDFIVIAPNKAAAQETLKQLTDKVHELGLELNPKTAIHPWQRGIDFCGYRTWPTHILPRKKNIKRAKNSFRHIARKYRNGDVDLDFVRQRVMSFLAYTKHCNAKVTTERTLEDLRLIRDWSNRPPRHTA